MKKKYNLFKSIDKIVTEIPVKEIMSPVTFNLHEDDSASTAIKVMATKDVSGVLVCNDDKMPCGIVSNTDIVRKIAYKNKSPGKVKLKDIMSKKIVTISPETSIAHTSNLMEKHDISRIPIIKDKKIVGLVSKTDLVEKLNDIYYQYSSMRWVPIIVMGLVLVIFMLLVAYVNK